MDIIVTISETVRKRFKRFLGYDSVVIYPPCETERFQWIEEGNFYLSTARLDPMKRVDLIVKAFKKMPDKRLVVVSGGADMPRIKQIAEESPNIEVLGWISEAQLCDLMGRCIATIYIPRDEDFGISPVESMAAGKPVIGVQEGGLLETVGGGRAGAESREQRERQRRGRGEGKRIEGRGQREESREQRAEGGKGEDRGGRRIAGYELWGIDGKRSGGGGCC